MRGIDFVVAFAFVLALAVCMPFILIVGAILYGILAVIAG